MSSCASTVKGWGFPRARYGAGRPSGRKEKDETRDTKVTQRTQKGEGFQFPYLIPLNVFGRNSGDFERVVFDAVRKHIPELEWEALSSQASTGENYVSVTVTFTAQSRDQLEQIYQELNRHELVLMTL